MNAEQQAKFISELKELLRQHKVRINFGCGCCMAGMHYTDKDGISQEIESTAYSLDWKDKNE